MQQICGYEAARAALLAANSRRVFSAQPEQEARVREICEAVRTQGDDAVLRLERQFDCPTLELAALRVTSAEIDRAWNGLDADARRALQHAAGNIEAFHRQQPDLDWSATSADGTLLGQRYTPIERVGMYAPNFRAAYPSTVLMLAIPARVAGVPQQVLASPPGADGNCHPVILAAAKVAGIDEIYKLGGAVAVAAMAYGTPHVPRVDKIVGPGSIWVTLAKKHVYGSVGIDGLYGPSEVVVLAESGADAAQLAADLVAQAEHGADSFVCFISPSRELCNAVLEQVEAQLAKSPRAELLRESLDRSLVLQVETMEQACQLSDLAAAEHVEIWSAEAAAWSNGLRHAGAIFLNTPVPLGDYLAGPSHVLPTGVTARYAHGVGVETFLKRTSLISASSARIRALADDLEVLANLEDLPGHAAAVHHAAGGQRP